MPAENLPLRFFQIFFSDPLPLDRPDLFPYSRNRWLNIFLSQNGVLPVLGKDRGDLKKPAVNRRKIGRGYRVDQIFSLGDIKIQRGTVPLPQDHCQNIERVEIAVQKAHTAKGHDQPRQLRRIFLFIPPRADLRRLRGKVAQDASLPRKSAENFLDFRKQALLTDIPSKPQNNN